MMMSPEAYIKSIEKKSYEQLLEEKENLNKKIEEFESNQDKSAIISPSPEVKYQCNLEYMSKLCNLIAEKYREKENQSKQDEVQYNGIEQVDQSVFTNFANMNCTEIKNLIEEKQNLLKDKLDGKIDDKEKENSGYLYWNCKMILRNISMACDKLTKNFKDELSSEEVDDFINKSNIITTNEKNWKNIDDIKLTYNQIINNKHTTNIVRCMCNNEIQVNWQDDEKFKMVRCPNCNAEIKLKNPKFIEKNLDSIISSVANQDPY